MTAGCPICRPTCSNTVRAMMSVALPAVKGTTTWIGLAGQLCALAPLPHAGANSPRMGAAGGGGGVGAGGMGTRAGQQPEKEDVEDGEALLHSRPCYARVP